MESHNDSHSDHQHSSSWDSQKQGTSNGGGGSCSSNSVDNEALQPHCSNMEQRRRYAENILRDEQVKPSDKVAFTPYFLQLPNEILVRIINYPLQPTILQAYFERSGYSFNQIAGDQYARQRQRYIYTWALVSKQFYAIANPLLWMEPVLDIFHPRIKATRRMQQLLDCLAVTQQPLADYIRTLVLSHSFCSDTDLLRLMPSIRHAETLTINNLDYPSTIPRMTSKSFQDLPRHCPHLTSLTLTKFSLSDAAIHAIGQHCRQLNDLTLKSCSGLRDDMFDTLSSCCPLEKLHLTDGDFHGIFPEDMAMALTTFQGLTHLTLDGSASLALAMTLAGKISPFGDNNDKRRATEAVIASWPHLKKLHLGHCKFMDDATWIRFVQTHPHLVSVHLSEACLTDASLDAMAGCLRDALSSVVFTNINAISTVGVHRLIQNCKRLVRASFRQCAQILAGDFGKREMDNMRRVHNTNWELDNDEQHLVNTTTVMHLA